jgi:hypothetical protein
MAVWDSKDKAGPALLFTSSEWRTFVGAAKNDEFDCCLARACPA